VQVQPSESKVDGQQSWLQLMQALLLKACALDAGNQIGQAEALHVF
jgi:hypothetical protein